MSVSLIEEPNAPWPPELQALWREIEARDQNGLRHIPQPVLAALADAQAAPRSAWAQSPAPLAPSAPSAHTAQTAASIVRHTASTRRVRRFWGWVENMVCFEHPQAEVAYLELRTVTEPVAIDHWMARQGLTADV